MSSTQQMRDSALLRATTELFIQELVHDRDEIRRYEELVSHLLPKVRVEDRAFVAEKLSTRFDAPVAVMRMLAKDRLEIAGPVIRRSQILGPSDLLAVIAATGAEHHRLIAQRSGLTGEVIKALRIAADRDQAVPPPLPTADTGKAVASGATASPAPQAARQARPEANWFAQREAIPFRTNRFDPWHFLGLDRAARLHMMAEIATRPPIRRYPGPAGRLDRAFRAILGAAQIVGFARSGRRAELVEAISDSLELERDVVTASLDDASGEPLAVLLKALALDSVQAQQVFLLAMPNVGRDVTAFFRLCDIYAGMEASVAETLTQSWRAGPHPTTPRHEPLFAANGERHRDIGAEPVRENRPPPAERMNGSSGA